AAVRYDRDGDQHYDVISAFIKSIRVGVGAADGLDERADHVVVLVPVAVVADGGPVDGRFHRRQVDDDGRGAGCVAAPVVGLTGRAGFRAVTFVRPREGDVRRGLQRGKP